MTPDQVRAARKLLGWSRDRLGGLIDQTVGAVIHFERYGAGGPASREALVAIRSALEAAGVEFLDGDSPGVKLRNASAAPSTLVNAAPQRRTPMADPLWERLSPEERHVLDRLLGGGSSPMTADVADRLIAFGLLERLLGSFALTRTDDGPVWQLLGVVRDIGNAGTPSA